jgi:hypothetical protein
MIYQRSWLRSQREKLMYRRIGATLGMLISLTLPAAAEEPAETAGRCAVALADAMRLHGEYADVLDGKRFVAFRQNKPTPALLDYHRTLCPKIRKAGVFHELECAVGIALLPPELGEAAKGAREANLSIIKLCDSQFPAKPLSNAAYQA